MELITVRCKADLGYHLEHGAIMEGRVLQIRPDQMSDELFEIVTDQATTKKTSKKTE